MFGTAVFLESNPLLQELWAGELECVAVADDASQGGRMMDVFVDRVLAAASTGAGHLLDPDFTATLEEDEAELSAALQAFRSSVPDGARATPAWAVVEDALRRLGG